MFAKFREKFVENRVGNVLTNYLSLRLNLFFSGRPLVRLECMEPVLGHLW